MKMHYVTTVPWDNEPRGFGAAICFQTSHTLSSSQLLAWGRDCGATLRCSMNWACCAPVIDCGEAMASMPSNHPSLGKISPGPEPIVVQTVSVWITSVSWGLGMGRREQRNCACTYTCAHTFIYAHIRILTYVIPKHIYVSTLLCINRTMVIYSYVHMCVWSCILIYIIPKQCIHTNVCIHVFTYVSLSSVHTYLSTWACSHAHILLCDTQV